jgi:hypothetical protein
MMTGGVLQLFNKTPADWHAKNQGTAETGATCGSEFIAARTATEQIIDNRLLFRCLGVLVKESSMFGDNESVVNSCNILAGKLQKRHIALPWHQVREWIAASTAHFVHTPGAVNPTDMLRKYRGCQQTWTQLQALLFWQGDTTDLLKDKDSLHNRILFCLVCRGVTIFPHVDKMDTQIKWACGVQQWQMPMQCNHCPSAHQAISPK